MADETSWAVALWVEYGRIEAILLSCRYAARHTLLMCCCVDSVWSRWTPRFLTEDLNGMRLPPMSTLSLPTELRREVDATGRTSVFSAFENSDLCLSFFADFVCCKDLDSKKKIVLFLRCILVCRNYLYCLTYWVLPVFVIRNSGFVKKPTCA